MQNSETLKKQTVFNYTLMFSIVRSAIGKLMPDSITGKTDKIIFNSVMKAVDRHCEEGK